MAEREDLLAHLVALIGDLEPAGESSQEDLDTLRQAITGAFGEEPDVLIHRREVPVLTTQNPVSLPVWAAGRAIERTLGPFRDLLGRDIWFDLFRIVRQVRLVRTPGGAPFLSLPLRGLTVHGPLLRLGPGSVWMASALLAVDAPAGGFTGLRIRGGSLTASASLFAALGPEIVVPAGVTCTLEIELDPATPPAGSGPGEEARRATAETPAHTTFVFAASHATLTAAASARLTAYGTTTHLSLTPGGAPHFIPALNRLLVPFRADIDTFTVADARSTLFFPSGEAPVRGGAWALPVAVTTPATLGDASGAGALALLLADGLEAAWQGRSEPLPLGAVRLLVEPGRLALSAETARGAGARQQVTLWAADPGGPASASMELTWPSPFPLSFLAHTTGTEALFLTGSLAANLDRPLTLDGNRVPVRVRQALTVLVQAGGAEWILVRADLEPPRDGRPALAFALINAVLRASPARSLLLAAAFDGARATKGALTLGFALHYLLPTLPDPYVANHELAWRRLHDAAGLDLGLLTARVDWKPTDAPRLGFTLPPAAAGLTTPSPRSPREQHDKDEHLAERLNPNFGDLLLLDVSTRAAQFGVSFSASPRRSVASGRAALAVEGMALRGLPALMTVPAVQWEAVATPEQLPPPPPPLPAPPPFPTPMTFADSGGPSFIALETVNLVPIAPRPTLRALVDNFAADGSSHPAVARFTLPFGIVALAGLRKPTATDKGAEVTFNRPRFAAEGLAGGHQLTLRAVDPTLPTGATPSFAGFTFQRRNGLSGGVPTGKSVLGDDVDIIFNDYLGPAATSGGRPQVPVTRIDLSGYGESLFSDWRNPTDDPVAVSQARFDVLLGRAAFEVIQVRSILLPYAVRVVRSVTIERKNNARVVRRDSGWQAVSDGEYLFPPEAPLVTHPGVVRAVRHVTNIRDTGQIRTIDGIKLAAVVFDGGLEIEGVFQGGGAAGVPARGQLGYVQLTPAPFLPATYEKLIQQAGPLGGAVDCRIRIGGTGQAMRVGRVGVGVTHTPGPQFAMAAWGSPQLPGGGQWSFLRLAAPGEAPQPVDRDLGVPLIRTGAAPAPPPATAPYRFADPADLAHPDNPAADYGIVHATGTQRTFFPRPKIEPGDPRITSTQIAAVADPYTLAKAVGLFPRVADAIPFPGNDWAMRIAPDGNYRLEMPSPTFPVLVGQRTISDAHSVRSFVDYAGSALTLAIDTAAAVPWSFRLQDVSLATSSGALGEVMRMRSNIEAAADALSKVTDPRIVFGKALQLVQEVMVFLQDLGLPSPLTIEMTNQPKLKLGLKIPLDDLFELLPLPPGGPEFDDTELMITETIASPLAEAELVFGASLLIPTPFDPIKGVGRIELKIGLSTDSGTTFVLTLGAGAGVSFKAGPFECKAYYLATQFLIVGDTAIGLGVGLLIKGTIDLGIVSVDVSVEAKMALVRVTCPGVTIWGAAKVTFAVEVTIAFVIDIDFEVEAEWDQNLNGGPCELPDVL